MPTINQTEQNFPMDTICLFANYSFYVNVTTKFVCRPLLGCYRNKGRERVTKREEKQTMIKIEGGIHAQLP